MRLPRTVSIVMATCTACTITTPYVLTQASPAAQASSTDSAAEVHDTLQKASAAMHQGDMVSAERELRHALEIDPHSLAALNNLGIVLSREGKPADAIPLYEEALKVRPDDAATKRNLAVAYFKSEQYTSAWSLLAPMAVAPTDFQILDLSGLSLFALDRYQEAAEYLERANQADPSDLETLDMLGKAYLRAKNYKAMPSVFERIMKLNPNSAAGHVMMGTAYDEMSDRPNAIKEYQAAVAADPTYMGAHSGLGYLYFRQGDSEQAEKEMRAELERYPTDPVANCILGQVLLNSSQLEDAAAHFQAALKVNPKYGEALFGLGKTEIAQDHPAAAVEPLRKAIQIDPDYAEAHFVLGTALRQTGHAEEGKREQKISVDIQDKKRTAAIQKTESQDSQK
jgi:tetratricopeptide (TPR) repeat protein